jgi:hypothetical protein
MDDEGDPVERLAGRDTGDGSVNDVKKVDKANSVSGARLRVVMVDLDMVSGG